MRIEILGPAAQTRAEQEPAIGALQTQCDILWAQLDALHLPTQK
jgi:hypothetical protein